MQAYKLNFEAVNKAALTHSIAILQRWLPDGKIHGHEYTAKNPRRQDHALGSFRINIHSGKWADFATGDKGAGFISLAAYLSGQKPYDIALELAQMLGIEERSYV